MIPVVVFWIFAGLGFYVWIGYPIILKLAASVFGRPYSLPGVPDEQLPTITILIAVHNGEHRIRRKLDAIVALDYPARVKDVVVVSDGSTDRTEEIVREYEGRAVRLIVSTANGGKSAAQSFAMESITSEIVVLTDLEADLASDFLRVVASAFADGTVGCVSSEVMWRNTTEGDNPRAGGIYWRFEIALRRWETHVNAMAYASGQAMAFRRRYFRPLPEYAGDDCLIPLDVIQQGARCLSVAEAQSTDLWAPEAGSEFSARVRMTQRNMTGTLMYPGLFNPVSMPLIAWSLFSHKILRWLTPYFVIGALASNAFLLGQGLYVVTLVLALAALAVSGLGLAGQIFGIRVPIAGALGSLLVVNVGFFVGVLKSASGRKVYAYGRKKTP